MLRFYSPQNKSKKVGNDGDSPVLLSPRDSGIFVQCDKPAERLLVMVKTKKNLGNCRQILCRIGLTEKCRKDTSNQKVSCTL